MSFRVGIIGAGFATEQYHIPAWKNITGCSIESVCDVNPERLCLIRDMLGIDRTYTDYKEMLSDGGLDIVTIATPAYCHHEQIIDSLNCDLHVVTEKPMAVTHRQCLDAVTTSIRLGKKLMCLQQSRFKNSTTLLKRSIDSGDLGEIYYASAKSLRSRGIPKPAHFKYDNAQGGGPLYDSGPHIIDVAWFLMGRPELKRVTANSWNKLAMSNTVDCEGAKINWQNYHCEDLVVAHVEFSNGSVLSLEISYLANMPFSKRSECTLWGTDGGAHWPKADIYLNDGGNVTTRGISVPRQGALGTEMLNSFVESVVNDTPVAIDPMDSAKVIRIIQAIHDSCRSGTSVACH